MHALSLLLLVLMGLALALGGGYLLYLGGSPFYLFSGLVMLAVAAGLWRRRRWALWLYAAWLLALLVWSLWEVGLHWWPLATRLGIPVLIGLLLALPAVRRNPQGTEGGGHFGPAWPVLGTALLSAAVALSGIPRPLHEIEGTLAMDIVTADARLGDGALPEGEWTAYGRTQHGQRYSPLKQITPANVHQLEVAWQIRTGDMRGPKDIGETTYQATPLKVHGLLYLCTPHSWAMALDADTGKERWRFDPQSGLESKRQHQTCRGVAYHGSAAAPAAATTAAGAGVQAASLCANRIFLPTADAKLYALDAATGKPCADFGKGGALDLTHNMPFKQPGFYYSTSPPVVAGDRVIVSGAVNDNYDVRSPSGVIRAYDVRSGKLLWNWDSGNPEATAPFDPDDPAQTYTASSPNSWSVGSADTQLGLAYFPMGNRTPDQLGMYRNAEEEKYSSSVVALDLATGRARWVRQFVHHDLWDMDAPAQPVLLDLDLPQGRTPAIVVPTKQGDIYVLDRRDGSPLHAVGERPAPQGTDIPGQRVAPMQPFSALSFEPSPLRESDMWGASLVDQMLCRIAFRQLRYEGRYTPPSMQGSLIYPGNFGVFNWGSVAVDPQRQVMFGMPTYLAFVSTLMPKARIAPGQQSNVGEQGLNEIEGAGYGVRMHPFLSPIGVPCQVPPWGTVAAADLRSGKIAYQRRNGTIRDLSPLPLPIRIGVPGIGGPLITAGGVAFLGAAVDNNFRAYDLASGKVLWDVRIPAGGQATPMSYLNSRGEQMVVLVAGGHGSVGTKAGDYVIAYQLKR
ncbi:membrane-bound PQQ-dependent dehydrogenase, glucose/quinate/shikimate family [Comamonas endophytica]|uniref:Membrane-bound PQQ-dependent dehydrogenase, glucose/quinate/shikimate family n=2 Tax=Comamonas endophytica TaxID=2949090 RepID=A0ABY6GD99_9BURK|nr:MULTISPECIES: membrane-bound PQQ-dependent dehydrogenase, glucose/quinate/shikimate family [unclassified Acidovorax]MCD2512568.1 membrane-bound PQQ-dependent dehydrogenase, glucose/quinate/shikimate family [Acidovorax sp. D4N7]UYG53069.1 membrane-bound PQQ-dependent dehydrogenase, glucose/quinate/shikimate family [Acidovorax sp. 5MLIR]